eukprot:13999593-Ditylum_brightwellii.AAC.1
MDTGPDDLHNYGQDSGRDKSTAQGANDQFPAKGISANDATQNTTAKNRNQITTQPNPQRNGGKAATATF